MDSRPQTLGLKKRLTTSAQGPHPFPFRTRQLSPAAPMVLPLRGGGRVGRRQPFLEARTLPEYPGFFLAFPSLPSPIFTPCLPDPATSPSPVPPTWASPPCSMP